MNEEAARLREDRAASIIDAETLQGETLHEVDDQICRGTGSCDKVGLCMIQSGARSYGE